MLRLNNISKTYHEELFSSINLVLGNQEKVGLVGLNGTGKTTLLKIIAGLEAPTNGGVELQQEKLGYLPQQFDITQNGELTLLGEFMESLVRTPHEVWRIERILGKLQFGEVDEFADLSSFSPGQLMKLYLARIMIEEPTILLLDEPTNHLDITGIEWLEQFISRFKGIVIMISHDREFLNAATNHTLEIDEQKLHMYPGNYDWFVEEKQHRLEERAKQFQLQEARRQKIERMVALAKKQGGGKKQAKKISAARKRLEREVTKNEISEYTKKEIKDLSISGSVHSKKMILTLEELQFSYADSEPLLRNINLEVFGSETLWLYGPNGTGKSTLLKIITDELKQSSGKVRWGQNIGWSYFAQNQTELDITESVQEYFYNQTNVDWDRSFGALEKFMFDRSLRDKRVCDLSPGQKSRLTFAVFAQQEFECLILDEPTNHLDIETKEAIEQALHEYQGAIILVSHDRYFAEQLEPDRIATISEGKLSSQVWL